MYLDNGTLTGMDVELLGRIFNEAGIKIQFRRLPWKRNLIEVRKGTAHCAPGASESDERKQFAYFSAPYREERVVLVVRKGESVHHRFVSLKDIKDSAFELGVTRGYYYGDTYDHLQTDKTFLSHVQIVTNDEQNYKKLMIGRIDGFLIDFINLQAKLKNLDIAETVEIHPMHVYSTDIHVMFSKQSTSRETVDAFDSALQRLKDTGVTDQIFNKYIRIQHTAN